MRETNQNQLKIPEEIEKEVERKGGFDAIISLLLYESIQWLTYLMKALADEKRLTILHALHQQRMCACMLAELTDCSSSKCSYHLSKLKEMGLVTSKYMGNYIVYSLTPYGRKIVRHLKKMMEARK